MGVMNSGMEALIVQYNSKIQLTQSGLLWNSSGVSLIQPRNFAIQEHS